MFRAVLGSVVILGRCCVGDDKHCEASYCPNGQQGVLPVLNKLYFKGRVDGVEGESRLGFVLSCRYQTNLEKMLLTMNGGGKVPLVHCSNSCMLFCSSPGISRRQETRASLLNTVYTL